MSRTTFVVLSDQQGDFFKVIDFDNSGTILNQEYKQTLLEKVFMEDAETKARHKKEAPDDGGEI